MTRRRPAPLPVGGAVAALADRLAPQTLLADVQRMWPAAVGEAVAARATPTAERGGMLVVSCEAAVWAQELDLMGPELVARLNAALGADRVVSLRCQAAPARGWGGERR
jgi:predicted nucleic acid-binding Zn ribbon protein